MVTVDDSGGAVAVTGMQFTVDGYRIDGDPLTLSGPQSVIRVGDGSSDGADVTATIAADLTGAATLVKDDLGTLVLSGTDTYTGGTVIAGGTLQIGDGGTTGSVVGDIADAAALIFDRSDSFTYAGVISGTGALTKQGAGTLTLSGDSPFTGITTISDGTHKIGDGGTTGSLAGDIVDDAALIFERSDALTYAGVISGTGELSKQGAGTLTLSGDSPLSGPTTVGAGTLVVDGSLAHSPFTIQSGATLAGGGTVGDLTVDAGGTVAPGLVTPITTLSVAGDVSFASGSTLAVTVLPDGRSDRLAATGTITLGGSTLAVTAGAGKFNPTTHATILTAGGGVTGSFGNVTSNLAFLTPSLAYGAGGITLGFTQTAELASAGNNRNQRTVADALQALGSASPLYDAVIGQDAGGARQAFNALSGEAHASAITAGLSDQRLIRDAILDRLSRPAAAPAAGQTMALAGRHGFGAASEAPDDTLGFWSQAIGDTGTNRGDAEVAALSHQTAGVIFGGDVGGLDVPGGTARLGAAGGYSTTISTSTSAPLRAVSTASLPRFTAVPPMVPSSSPPGLPTAATPPGSTAGSSSRASARRPLPTATAPPHRRSARPAIASTSPPRRSAACRSATPGSSRSPAGPSSTSIRTASAKTAASPRSPRWRPARTSPQPRSACAPKPRSPAPCRSPPAPCSAGAMPMAMPPRPPRSPSRAAVRSPSRARRATAMPSSPKPASTMR